MAESPPPAGINPHFDFDGRLQHDLQPPPEPVDQTDQTWIGAVDAARRIYKDRETLQEQATHDELTGLPNLRGFNQALKSYLDDTGVKDIDVIFVDGTNIKAINDELDHAEGDRAIIGIAGILSASIRKGDILARIGGDEFVIVPDGKGELPPELTDEQRADERLPDDPSLELRIAGLTESFLKDNPHYSELGMDIAVGRKRVKIDEHFDFAEVRKEAEAEMTQHKARQHAAKGRYR